MSVKEKLETIKAKAQQSLTTNDDSYNKVSNYIAQASEIREANKLHNEIEVQKIEDEFLENVREINEKAKDSEKVGIKEKLEMLEDAYFKYAKKKASLDRLGNKTLFYDSLTDMYVMISWYQNKALNGKVEERLLTNRLKPTSVQKFIDLDSKQKIGFHIKAVKVREILRNFRPYIKEFEPLKPKFYGDFFNTYTPNGFLDVQVENTLNLERFVNITLPARYPHINALLENIAPYLDERVFMLNWLSTIFNTAQKTRTAIVLKGIQRTGKGVFTSKIIEYAMNPANCFTATNSNLSDNFNNYLEDKLFIKFDEVKGDFKTDKDIANKIKLIVSENEISIRAMHSNPYMIKFYANCIFLSNEDVPVPMDKSDERLSIIETRSKTLAEVAKEKFGLEIHQFIELIEKERDEFIIHLKMCKYNKQLASSTIDNTTKKAIQDASATIQSILKSAFRGKDIETIEEMIHEAIRDSQNEQLIKTEDEVFKEGVDGAYKVKRQIPFAYSNSIMAENFIKELKAGQLSATSLKWFTKALNIEHALKNDLKFGNFWNIVLTTPLNVKLKTPAGIKQERFRLLSPHHKVTQFFYDNQTWIYTGKKTAELLLSEDEIF